MITLLLILNVASWYVIYKRKMDVERAETFNQYVWAILSIVLVVVTAAMDVGAVAETMVRYLP